MFGLGQKRQEKKAKKELEKLEKKEAKVKEKLAKLEEKQKKKNKKKGIEEKPAPSYQFYEIELTGTEPYMGQIRYELTEYNPEYNEPLFKPEEGDVLYKYTQKTNKGEMVEEDGKIKVKIDGYMVGFIPDEEIRVVKLIVSDHPEVVAHCSITGGEYKEYTEDGVEKGFEPFVVKIILRYEKNPT